jgi:hypothetical protein
LLFILSFVRVGKWGSGRRLLNFFCQVALDALIVEVDPKVN